MAKIAALGAYLYQALLAFGLLIAVSNLLPALDYAAYSLFIAVVQFADAICFQWIRAACSRFYPGPDGASERAQRGVIVAELSGSAVVCLFAALLAPLFGAPLWLGLIGAVAAILQGAGELHLTMLRFRQQFRLFSWLQGARATIMAATTIGGAAIRADLAFVLAGVLAGNLIYCALAWVLARRILPLSAGWNRAIARDHLTYGGTSAGAAIANLSVPLGLKSILIGTLGPAAAGPMLALDLLQRPFVMIVSSLQAIRFPELVAVFDREGDSESFRAELGRFYALLVGFSLIGAAGLIAVLGLATWIAIPAGLQPAFLRTAPFFLLMALLRPLISTLLPTPAHLRRRLPAIIGLAVLDCAMTCAGALIAAWLFPGADAAIAAGAATGAGAALALGIALMHWRSFAMPWQPVALPAAALALSWLSAGWFSGNLPVATGLALAAVLAFSARPFLTLLRWIAR
ncbi:oligosaccharide flippase family protein [Bosea sp. (in: a-proteobacteria)]|uniref:oligosaccharide flippase family protein n=1 Tax=Bosea sp. (in: a-proteobacteria) TaxID=1871050 RepID=UPI0026357EFD|nr:oligosaccharide flippase family protein [Bosea sp. (in: a-proteobacteria)]MCO5093013.1 oligosaccharide flippase family protein [Bosea sp. (in: a-proteobacteria)]